MGDLTLAEFLAARLGEKERAAKAVKDQAAKRTHYRAGMIAIADRELREVEAGREILAAYDPSYHHGHGEDYGYNCGLEFAVSALAAVYSDHPDYREEWKP